MTKVKIYPEVESDVSIPAIEEKILHYWKKYDIFQKSIDQRTGKEFVFYDGPPFANGLPHYGHLLTGFIKDSYARYQTLKGKRVERRFGWDCHGLPAEMEAEKELKVSGRTSIIDFGIGKFNEFCRSSVMKYANEWERYVERQGRWVDLQNDYRTMDLDFMESVLWGFKQLYEKGLVYQAMRVMPYSWACETPLSNFETRLDNSYRERTDKSVTLGFLLNQKPKFAPEGFDEYRILAWTTTPWTLPSNLALAVGDDIDYVTIAVGKICYIVGKFAVKKLKKEFLLQDEEILDLKGYKGSLLKGLTYTPPFDYFIDHPNSFRILSADFVTEQDGTGIVHVAPGFGEEDQILCNKNGIKLVCPVDSAGRFTKEVPDFQNVNVFDANDGIIVKLKERGAWFKTEQYLHNYPHCWRTDTPLIYKAVPSWYIKVTEFKDRMVELNQRVNWIPGNVKDNLFGKWLENAKDWSISRNRFWGTPIPIWISDDNNYPRIDVYGSIAELERDFNVKITDLHRPFIDNLTRPNPDDPTGNSTMRRIEDVFDCWFESGSMPYAQIHYPFENKERFESHFPADFIVEYAAQTRGWFYTLFVLGTALFDRPPFLNCICHGVILDTNGQKLSKRLNNYVDPFELFSKYGADALRSTMLSSSVTKGHEFLIDKEGKIVFDNLRLSLKPLWNAYHFFVMYSNADSIVSDYVNTSDNILDIFILAKLRLAVEEIDTAMEKFDSVKAYATFRTFFEVLNNWYIRRSRSRFWKNTQDQDKQAAYNTLFTCLSYICQAASPLLPILCEEVYLSITNPCGKTSKGQSVHLLNYPDVSNIKFDQELVASMDKIIDVCSTALCIRNSENARIRQPLSNLTIVTKDAKKLEKFIYLVLDEVNVKSVQLLDNVSDYADSKLSLNFSLIGKRLGHLVKDIIRDSKNGKWNVDDQGNLSISGTTIYPEEFSIELSLKDQKGTKLLSSSMGLVILDLNITEELRKEGLARDLIRLIQQGRKEAKFDVSDHILMEVGGNDLLGKVVKEYANLITEQTLSKLTTLANSEYKTFVQLEEMEVEIKMSKDNQLL